MNIACCDLSWMLSGKDYWYAIISAGIGAAIGIAFTYWHFYAQERKFKEKCISRIRSCLIFNQDRLNQAVNFLNRHEFPNYPMDTTQLNHWLTQSVDILGDDLVRDIDWERYQLDHITTKILAINNLILTKRAADRTQAEAEYLQAVRVDLLNQIQGVLGHIPDLLQRIERSLSPVSPTNRTVT